jgi:hypothetical protein
LSGNPGGGRFVDSTRYDSLVVEWGMTEGLYLIGVQEVAYGGCEGEWTYMMVDLKGTQFVPESSYRLTGGELLVPINPNLWKNVRWTPNTVTNGQPPGTFKISQVGTYQVTMEDMHGCKHSETITVTN